MVKRYFGLESTYVYLSIFISGVFAYFFYFFTSTSLYAIMKPFMCSDRKQKEIGKMSTKHNLDVVAG